MSPTVSVAYEKTIRVRAFNFTDVDDGNYFMYKFGYRLEPKKPIVWFLESSMIMFFIYGIKQTKDFISSQYKNCNDIMVGSGGGKYLQGNHNCDDSVIWGGGCRCPIIVLEGT